MQGSRLRAVAAWAALTFCASTAGAGPVYSVSYLGASEPIGINNSGEVGLASSPIASLGGFGTARDYFSFPATAQTYESFGPAAGTLSTPSTQGPLPGGSTSPWVNNAGDFTRVDGQLHPYVSVGGVQTSLPMLNSSALNDPKAINASDQIVGEATMNVNDSGYHAFLYSGGVEHDLGTLGGRASGAEAINNQGTVVGWAMVASTQPHYDGAIHAFMYNGTMHDLGPVLGTAYSHAYGINATGAIVGDMSSGYYGPDTRAFLLEGGKVTDLNSLLPTNSPWYLTTALAINDVGQILGIGTYNGVESAFLLTPSTLGDPPSVQFVPEPSTLAFFGLAIAGLALHRRRRLGRPARS